MINNLRPKANENITHARRYSCASRESSPLLSLNSFMTFRFEFFFFSQSMCIQTMYYKKKYISINVLANNCIKRICKTVK